MVVRLDVATVNVENYVSLMRSRGWEDAWIERNLSEFDVNWLRQHCMPADFICRISPIDGLTGFQNKLYDSRLGMTYTQGRVSIIVRESQRFREVSCQTVCTNFVQGVKITGTDVYSNDQISLLFALVIFPDRTEASIDSVKKEVTSMLDKVTAKSIKNPDVFSNVFRAFTYEDYAYLFGKVDHSRMDAYRNVSVLQYIFVPSSPFAKLRVAPYLNLDYPCNFWGIKE